jgi:nitronate monooxygenase
MIRTWLTERLGVPVPVVCAPMAGVASGELAAAVSAAGGLGMIGVGAKASPDWIRRQGRIVAGSPRPFGIGLQAWALQQSPGQLDAALALSPALISVSYGRYTPYLDRIQRAGILVATTVGSLREAHDAAAAGVDVIVARGGEGGGHGRNDVATLPLLQSILDAVELPVLAAGGIGSARGLAAVLAAGAAGAWVGTAFLTCVESDSPPAARARLIAATDTDTVYGRVFDLAAGAGWPAEFGERALRTAFFDRWVGREAELAELVQRDHEQEQDELAKLDAGQGVALLLSERTAAEVISEFSGAVDHLRRTLGREDGPEVEPRRPDQARDRDPVGRARQGRPRDALGRPLPYADPRAVQPVSEDPLPPDQALTLAQSLLDQGRAFSAHEVLEAVWKASPPDERDLWQGLAQLCVGITHAQRGNRAGATRLVRRAAGHLGPYAGLAAHGIDVVGLLHWCERNAADPVADRPRLRATPAST